MPPPRLALQVCACRCQPAQLGAAAGTRPHAYLHQRFIVIGWDESVPLHQAGSSVQWCDRPRKQGEGCSQGHLEAGAGHACAAAVIGVQAEAIGALVFVGSLDQHQTAVTRLCSGRWENVSMHSPLARGCRRDLASEMMPPASWR